MAADSPDLPRIIIPKRITDERGWFSETFHESRLREAGIPCRFVQDNLSCSTRAGTLRGFHFQIPPAAQAKLVSVVRGRILDVAVDVRRDAPTFGRHIAAELSADCGHQVYVPVGFAHAFMTLEDETIVSYKVSNFYWPAHDRGIRWNDPQIAFPWPVPSSEIIVSAKDDRLPFLKDFASPFSYDGHPLAPLAAPDLG
jgi:dTDP-4-dehydrorhamnose 3,5-epimerase